jgi:hypothetical protein
VDRVEADDAERAGHCADRTPDTPFVPDQDRPGTCIPHQCFGRADLHARCRIAVPAPVGKGPVMHSRFHVDPRLRPFLFHNCIE